MRLKTVVYGRILMPRMGTNVLRLGGFIFFCVYPIDTESLIWYLMRLKGEIAQSVERRTHKPKVKGSIPFLATIPPPVLRR